MIKKIITLSCTLLIYTSYADTYYTVDQQQPSLLHDSYGNTINYPCHAGGEPLVIYSTDAGNQELISSKNVIYPVYVKDGYKASPLSINQDEQSNLISVQNLIIQTINPAYGAVTFELSRNDAQPFYVNTVNYPSIEMPHHDNGTKYKYVSAYQIYANNDLDTPIKTTFKPITHYWMDQDIGILVGKTMTSLHAEAASWNQNGDWTNGELGRHVYPIRYRFSPRGIAGSDPKLYNGYGFWVCGGKQEVTSSAKKPAVYQDKV